jgi:hypothetical protein
VVSARNLGGVREGAVSHNSLGGPGRYAAMSTMPTWAETLQGEITPNDGGNMSTLQKLHCLLEALNPRERDAFLWSHNLVHELRSNEVGETDTTN